MRGDRDSNGIVASCVNDCVFHMRLPPKIFIISKIAEKRKKCKKIRLKEISTEFTETRKYIPAEPKLKGTIIKTPFSNTKTAEKGDAVKGKANIIRIQGINYRRKKNYCMRVKK